MNLKFGLRLPPCRDVRTVAEFAAEAESAGFDMAWFPDSQFLWRNVWTTVALAAERTSKIGLGIAVTNFETRHVAVTAAAAATIDELAPGRFKVGFGTGDSAVKTLGFKPTVLARMRSQIAEFRQLTRGESITYGESGDYAHREMRISASQGRQVPVYMAASGPKALALAGEVADGVLILSGIGKSLLTKALGHIEEGATRAGRSMGDIDLWAAAHTFVTPDRATAARTVKPLVITSAQLGAKSALASVGIDVNVPKVVPGVYPDVTHAVDWDSAIRASEQFVDDDAAAVYAQNFTLAGTADDVVERIEQAAELGVSNFYIQGPLSYVLPHEQLAGFRDEVLPRLRHDPVPARQA